MRRRYTVIPEYGHQDQIIGYLLWDNEGNCVVDNSGNSIFREGCEHQLAYVFDIKDRGIRSHVKSEDRIRVEREAKEYCINCERLNNFDQYYIDEIIEYTKNPKFKLIDFIKNPITYINKHNTHNEIISDLNGTTYQR